MSDKTHDQQTVGQTALDLKEFARAVLGNMILLLVLVGVERLFFVPGFYSSLIQHPFWIIVLIAAVMDGLFVGVVVAIAATLLMDWPPRPADADITAHYIQVAILPLQWLFAALCIGLFRQAELRKTKANASDMKRLQDVNEVLASDILNLEAHMSRAQLESLRRDGTQDKFDELVDKALALQAAELSSLQSLFNDLAAHCSSFPASILFTTSEGTLKALDAEATITSHHAAPLADAELLLALRSAPEVIVDRSGPFDGTPEQDIMVLAGITSPDRRTLHGAVALLASNRKSAYEAAKSARFLAMLLGPVLAGFRVPKIAVASDMGTPTKISTRKISHG